MPSVSDLYARKSSTDLGKSVARQERAWRSDCVTHDVTPGRVFVDPNFSASRYATKARPDYTALIDHIRSRSCEMVSLWEVTRGSRQMGEWVAFLDLCREMGVLIRIFGDGEDAQTYDPRRQRDREYLMKEGMVAEGEVERLRSRTRAGTADAAAQGRPPGPLLDGYRRVYGAPTDDSRSLSGGRRTEIHQVIDEPRAAIYRAAAEGLLAGVPANFIARVLNAWKVPTATGGRWAGSSLVDKLLKPGMEGHRVLNGVVVARNAWPAILDPQTAAALRQLKQSSARRRNRADNRLRYLLSGVMVCGRCGKPMQGRSRKGREVYECDPNRQGCGRMAGAMQPIDEVVTVMVRARLQKPDALAVFAPARDDSVMVRAQADLEALTDRLSELQRAAARPGGPSMALVAAAERELLPEIEKASKRVQGLRTPPVLRGYDPAHLAEHWLSYEVGERRAVVSALAEVVLSPAERPGQWSEDRLGSSRWRGSGLTWGDEWSAAGV